MLRKYAISGVGAVNGLGNQIGEFSHRLYTIIISRDWPRTWSAETQRFPHHTTPHHTTPHRAPSHLRLSALGRWPVVKPAEVWALVSLRHLIFIKIFPRTIQLNSASTVSWSNKFWGMWEHFNSRDSQQTKHLRFLCEIRHEEWDDIMREDHLTSHSGAEQPSPFPRWERS